MPDQAPGFQFRQSIQGAALCKHLILAVEIHLVDKIDVRPGSQILTGGLHGPVHLIAVIKPGFVGDDDPVSACQGGKFPQFQLRVAVLRHDGGVVEIASQAAGVFHDRQGLGVTEIIIVRQYRDASLKNRDGAETHLGDGQAGEAQFSITHIKKPFPL